MDVCVLTGDGRVDQFPPHPELRANGYDYHGMTTEVLVKDLEFKDGWLGLPSGMLYRLLVTYDRSLRPQTIRKIARLVAAGATVMGEKPDDAPGLAGFPASRDEVRKITDEVWGTDFESGRKGRVHGKGMVLWAHPGKTDYSGRGGISGPLLYIDCTSELNVLNATRIAPDFAYGTSGKEDSDHMLTYMHRWVNDMDFYFVSNQASRHRREECVFRMTARPPELWDAVTGKMRDLPDYSTTEDGRTWIPLTFEPGQSFFVVFRNGRQKAASFAEAKESGKRNFPDHGKSRSTRSGAGLGNQRSANRGRLFLRVLWIGQNILRRGSSITPARRSTESSLISPRI